MSMLINVSLSLHLGKRQIQVGKKVLGVCDDVTISVMQATPEELIELQKAPEIKLVKPSREEGPNGT